MGMALKSDVVIARRKAGTEKPIDLVYLSTLTMGDPVLEADILKMFVGQMPQYLGMVDCCRNDEEVRRAGHTIKGAARSVGALGLAEIAASAEKTGCFDRSELACEMDRITAYIATLS